MLGYEEEVVALYGADAPTYFAIDDLLDELLTLNVTVEELAPVGQIEDVHQALLWLRTKRKSIMDTKPRINWQEVIEVANVDPHTWRHEWGATALQLLIKATTAALALELDNNRVTRESYDDLQNVLRTKIEALQVEEPKVLEEEIAYWDTHIAQWEIDHYGQVVVVKGSSLYGFYDSMADALCEAAKAFGVGPYLVRQIIHPPRLIMQN